MPEHQDANVLHSFQPYRNMILNVKTVSVTLTEISKFSGPKTKELSLGRCVHCAMHVRHTCRCLLLRNDTENDPLSTTKVSMATV